MQTRTFRLLLVTAMVWLGSCLSGSLAAAAEREEPMLSHDVFFTLKEKTPEARAKLVAACQKYLADHPGVVWFAAGPLADELKRDVNDLDFDVALHVVFKNKAAHDKYQTAAMHLKFIAENEQVWSKVRVFDSYVAASTHGEIDMQGAKPAKKGGQPKVKRAGKKLDVAAPAPK